MSKSSARVLLVLSIVLAGQQTALAKKMYRWVDEQGNVFFSDQVPPEQVQHQREMLNEKARVVDVVEKEKTKEQREQDKALQKLRQEQEKIIAKQASYDKVLLSTFRSIDDMNLALDRKMQGFDARRKIVDGNLQRLQLQLQQQQSQAAELERGGTKVPEQLQADMAASKEQIAATTTEIARHIAEKEKAKKEFEADLARFRFLTQAKTPEPVASTPNDSYSSQLGVFVCRDAEQCERAWQSAGQFVKHYSTTGPDIQAEQLIMHSAPINDSDLSLSVSKLELENKQLQLFLDIRCHRSTLGSELCASDKVQAIRKAFHPYVAAALAAPQQ